VKFDLKVWEADDSTPMAPMVDMVFLLLIFFMVASHLNQLEKVEIEVPQAAHAAVPEQLNDRRTITI
jgi:biopolymer transport protein ExbD